MNTPGLETPGEIRWRVGHISDPIGFIPRERCSWNHRFDDSKQRFRTLYCAIRPETALREVLADLRRNTDEMARYLKTFGEEARADLPAEEISADWRAQNVLAPCRIDSRQAPRGDPRARHRRPRRARLRWDSLPLPTRRPALLRPV